MYGYTYIEMYNFIISHINTISFEDIKLLIDCKFMYPQNNSLLLILCDRRKLLTKKIVDILRDEIILPNLIGLTPLMVYVCRQSSELDISILKLLTKTIGFKTINGDTALMTYCSCSTEKIFLSVIKFLLKEIGMVNNTGDTALLYYLRNPNIEKDRRIIELLKDELFIKNKFNVSPIKILIDRNYQNINIREIVKNNFSKACYKEIFKNDNVKNIVNINSKPEYKVVLTSSSINYLENYEYLEEYDYLDEYEYSEEESSISSNEEIIFTENPCLEEIIIKKPKYNMCLINSIKKEEVDFTNTIKEDEEIVFMDIPKNK